MKVGLLPLLVLLMAASPLRGQGTESLQQADFVVGAVYLGADSSTVLRVMGRPDSTQADSGLGVDEHALLHWHFPGATITFFAAPRAVEGIALLSPTLTTARGLRVGDNRARVAELYGTPLHGGSDEIWLYADDPVIPRRLIVIRFHGDGVTFIYVRHFRA